MILDVSSQPPASPIGRTGGGQDTNDRGGNKIGSGPQRTTVVDDGNSCFTSSDSSASSSSATSASSGLLAYRDEKKEPSSSDKVSSSPTAATSMSNKLAAPTTASQRKNHLHLQNGATLRASEISCNSTVSCNRDENTVFEVSMGSPAQQKQRKQPVGSSYPTKPAFSPSASKTTNAQNQVTSQKSPLRLSRNRVFPTSPRPFVAGSSTVKAPKPSLRAYMERQQADGQIAKKQWNEPHEVVSPPQRRPSVETSASNSSDGLVVQEISFNPRDQLQRHLSVLSLGESIQPEELRARGIQPIIDISPTDGSVDDPSMNNPHSALRGNRPPLERRLSHLTLGNESYIMDLATQKQCRDKERHEEALEETLERVQQIVNTMDPTDRPDTDSEEYAIIFLRVLPQVKAALKLRYEEHDRRQDTRLNEALMDELDKREREKPGVEKSVCSGLADITEGNNSDSGSEPSRGIKVRLVGHQFRSKEDAKTSLAGNHTDSTQPMSLGTTVEAYSDLPMVYDRATKNRACVKIQALYRRYAIRSVFAPLLEGVHAHDRAQAQARAAIKLQASFRRYNTLKMYLSLVGLVRDQAELEHKSTIRIQAAYRQFRTRRFYVDVIEGVRRRKARVEQKAREENACVRLQAAARKYLTRSYYLELVDGIKVRQSQLKKEASAAVRIQNFCRIHIARELMRKSGRHARKKIGASKSEVWIEETFHDIVIEETVYDEIIDGGNSCDGSDEDSSFADEIGLRLEDDNGKELVEETIEVNLDAPDLIVDEEEEIDESEAEYIEISDYSDASYVEISDEEYETEEEMIDEGTDEVVSTVNVLIASVTDPTPSRRMSSRQGFKSPTSKSRKEQNNVDFDDDTGSTPSGRPTGKVVRSPSGKLTNRIQMFDSPKRSNGVSPCVAKRSWQKPIAKINLDGDSHETLKTEVNCSVYTTKEKDGIAEETDMMRVDNAFLVKKTLKMSEPKANTQGEPRSRTPWTGDSSGSPNSRDIPVSRPKKIWKKPQSSEGALPSAFAPGLPPSGDIKSWKNHIKMVAQESKPEIARENSTIRPVTMKATAVSSSTTVEQAQEINRLQTTKQRQRRSYESSAVVKKKLIMVQKMMECCEDAKAMEKLKKKQLSYMQALEDEDGEVSNKPQSEADSKLDLLTEKVGKKKKIFKVVKKTGNVATVKGDSLQKNDSIPSKLTEVANGCVALDDKINGHPEIAATIPQRKHPGENTSIKSRASEREDSAALPISKRETKSSVDLRERRNTRPIEITEKDDMVGSTSISSKKAARVRSFQSPFRKKSAGNISLQATGTIYRTDEKEKNERVSNSHSVASAQATTTTDATLPPKLFLQGTDVSDERVSVVASSALGQSQIEAQSGKLEVKRHITGMSSFQSPLKKKGGAVEASSDFPRCGSLDVKRRITGSSSFQSPLTKKGGGEKDSSDLPISPKCSLEVKRHVAGLPSLQSPMKKKGGAVEDNSSLPKSPKRQSLEVKRHIMGSSSFQSPLKKKIGAVENGSDAEAPTMPSRFQSSTKLGTKINGEVPASSPKVDPGSNTSSLSPSEEKKGVVTSSGSFRSPTKKTSAGPAGFQSPLKKAIVDGEENAQNGILHSSIGKTSITAGPRKARSSANIIPSSSPRKAKSSGIIEPIKSPTKKPVGVKNVVNKKKESQPSRPPLGKATKPVMETGYSQPKSNGSDAEQHFTLEDFEQKRVVGVDMVNWELSLREDEFQKHFEMSKDEFSSQPKWQREKQKRKIRVGF